MLWIINKFIINRVNVTNTRYSLSHARVLHRHPSPLATISARRYCRRRAATKLILVKIPYSVFRFFFFYLCSSGYGGRCSCFACIDIIFRRQSTVVTIVSAYGVRVKLGNLDVGNGFSTFNGFEAKRIFHSLHQLKRCELTNSRLTDTWEMQWKYD